MKNSALGRPLAAVAVLCLACGPAAAQISPAPGRTEHGSIVVDGVPPLDAALAERLARYSAARGATFLDWLPDGGLLIGTRFGNSRQIHRVASPLGMREQLTFYPDPVSEAAVPQVASAAGFTFLKDQGGDENSQIYYYRLQDRSVRLLTDGKALHGRMVWSRDGKHLAFNGNERDSASYDVYVVDVQAGTPQRLIVGGHAGEGEWQPLDFSLDGGKLLLKQYVSVNESYLFVADLASFTVTPLDTSGRKIGVRAARFAPDGRGVYLTSDESGEFAELRYLDLVTHEARELTTGVPWDIEDFDVSADGRYLAYVANEDGRSRLTVLDTLHKLEMSPAALPEGLIGGLRFDAGGRRLAFTTESAESPPDVYVYELEHNALVRWTKSEVGPVDEHSFVPAQRVQYPTWDRVGRGPRMISAFLYSPRSAGTHPVLVYIHGGPESQYRPQFRPFIQFVVNELGYAVVAPNVRGSDGYGKTFLKLDNGALREDAVKDIGSLIVWISLQSGLDREHVVVMGDSYGGYMTLASLAAYNDRLRGGIEGFGISNFVSFLEHTSAYRRDLRRAEYGDERDPKMRAYLNRISPLTNAGSIRRPLLIVAGANDPRVPLSESEQMLSRIRSGGGEVWFLAAKDEGHGFRKQANRDAYDAAAAAFLQRVAH